MLLGVRNALATFGKDDIGVVRYLDTPTGQEMVAKLKNLKVDNITYNLILRETGCF